ncbi:MAG: cupin domain-containing protein [Verrucomicrobia bacterium]|nr:cupin domain-containing protein [Verrucomicrobiota bacterium]
MVGSIQELAASEVVALLGLKPHPEGGHYIETYRDPGRSGGRAYSSAIYFLLAAGEVSHWHKVDATEVWHWYAGAALELRISAEPARIERHLLGPELTAGQRPQLVVPPYAWQAARSLGAWTLVGCTVAPAFEFTGFQLAPPGWEPVIP